MRCLIVYLRYDNSSNCNVKLFLSKWTYRTANSWGTDPDGTSCVGCGKQEHFRACADISINGDGNPQPPTTVNPIPTTTRNPVVTTNNPVTDTPCNNEGTGTYKRVCCKLIISFIIILTRHKIMLHCLDYKIFTYYK